MKVFVTLGGREFTVELDGDRAVVRSGGEEIPVTIISPEASTTLSERAEVLVVPGSRRPGITAGAGRQKVVIWRIS